jgi:hypothetical protein
MRNKGPGRQATTICKKEEGNIDRHWRVELKTTVTSGKKSIGLEDPQEDRRARICEASKRDVQHISQKEEMGLVERRGRLPPKQKKRSFTGKSRVMWEHRPLQVLQPQLLCERERERESTSERKNIWDEIHDPD